MSPTSLNKKHAPQTPTDVQTSMNEHDFIVSKTDTKGVLIYYNRIFQQMSAYSKKELKGANHNLIRHPDMPRVAFALCWEIIKAKKEFFGFVKNLRKDGGFYWVFSYITADVNAKGEITGYTSFRRKPSKKAIEVITPLYKELLALEKEGGIEASRAFLDSFFKENNTSYKQFILELQES